MRKEEKQEYERKENRARKYAAVFFAVFLAAGLIGNGTLQLPDLTGPVTLSGIQSSYSFTLCGKRFTTGLNGLMAKLLHLPGLFEDTNIYLTDDGTIVSCYDETSTDYEFEQTLSLYEFLKEQGTDLLYVSEPTKYTDDQWFYEQFGKESYVNRNTDVFLARLTEAEIPCMDLRERFDMQNRNAGDLFYRTDHHWTTETGFLAAKEIAEELNARFGMRIDLSVYDDPRYEKTYYKACWLGEQGRKVGRTYVGLDDFCQIKPAFQTDMTLTKFDGTPVAAGSFADVFINEDFMQQNSPSDLYEGHSWHYSYDYEGFNAKCVNNEVSSGKILILGDSFDHVMHPFLALGVHEADFMILRFFDDGFDLRGRIAENGYDAVVISYAQFMIGAHDTEGSSNYRMFCFE
ncbi:MAG: hypothetical protein J5518_00065 [Lachnospiraceae bacterium]|nr:hypothetical protein [Lachnospiraceae bacterium]